jgi:hypothetical protein
MKVLCAQRLSNLPERCEQFEVKLANGRTLTCQHKCLNVKLVVQDQESQAYLSFFIATWRL